MGTRSQLSAFLAEHDPVLDRPGALAERYFASHPSTTLFKLRQSGELLPARTSAWFGVGDVWPWTALHEEVIASLRPGRWRQPANVKVGRSGIPVAGAAADGPMEK